jgi:RNA polymerase sigma-70 factor (ECF subfamily)
LLQRAAAYAYAIVGNREDAEDAVQEAALKGYRALASCDRSRPFEGWWFVIVRNCAKDLLRRRKARPSTVSIDQAELPSAGQDHVERNEALWEAIGRLDPPHQEILHLRYFADCSYREIAASLGIPEGTVMSRLHAARRSLASIYKRVVA